MASPFASRPGYSSGGTIPLSYARWFFANPVDKITVIPAEEAAGSPRSIEGRPLLRFHSGSKSIDYWSNWGIRLTGGIDLQGRTSLVDLTNHMEVAAIIEWEAENPPKTQG